MIFRTATRADLPSIIAMITNEDAVVDPQSIEVDDAYASAFDAIETDARNELLVLDTGDGTVVGCLQVTYVPGLGRHGEELQLSPTGDRPR